ncbi:hypothetical protein AGLY_006396 [Aphis glycines]|uniref:Uncharacterized protein n=1 Tax=Aphis glycines TaxID=307491 RepID=A0A6G0TR47_APHGL|nr:hypothetical protein AGLY_006396 [Aphis glycines]
MHCIDVKQSIYNCRIRYNHIFRPTDFCSNLFEVVDDCSFSFASFSFFSLALASAFAAAISASIFSYSVISFSTSCFSTVSLVASKVFDKIFTANFFASSKVICPSLYSYMLVLHHTAMKQAVHMFANQNISISSNTSYTTNHVTGNFIISSRSLFTFRFSAARRTPSFYQEKNYNKNKKNQQYS